MSDMPRFAGRISEPNDARQQHAYELDGETYHVSYVHDPSRRPPVYALEVVKVDESGHATAPLPLDDGTREQRLVRKLGLFT